MVRYRDPPAPEVKTQPSLPLAEMRPLMRLVPPTVSWMAPPPALSLAPWLCPPPLPSSVGAVIEPYVTTGVSAESNLTPPVPP